MNISIDFIKYFNELGYKLTPPLSLLQEKIKTSFLFSVGYIDVLNNLDNPSNVKDHILSIQRCFRHFDLDKVFDGNHLSFFSMAGALRILNGECYAEYEMVYYLLTQIYKIPKDKIIVTYFAGDDINGVQLKSDETSHRNWLKIGVLEKNIIKGDFHSNFWMEGANSGETKSGICGPHTEIFINVSNDSSLNLNSNLIEVANLVKIEYQLDVSDMKLIKLPIKLFELGLGIERLEMVLMNEMQITNISKYSLAKSNLTSNTEENNLEQIDMMYSIFLDHFRGLVHLITDGARPGPKGRDYIIRKMIKKILTISSALCFDLYLNIDNLINIFSKADYDLNKDILLKKNIIKEVLLNEFERIRMK
jgi:alanyl-tRNA synthetase